MTRALRAARSGVGPVRGGQICARRSRCSSRSSPTDPAQPRCRAAAGDGATRRSARTRRRSTMFQKAAEIAPNSPGRAHVPRAALRARRRTGSAPCRCSSRSSPSRRIGCRRSKRWPRSASGRAASTTPSRCGSRSTRCASPRRRSSSSSVELAMDARADAARDRRVRAGARAAGAAFTHDLELGVLYLAARRFDEARDALDRVPPTHPDYPMALFKRAQVSVLLHEPDAAARIALARQKADATTRDADRAGAVVSGRSASQIESDSQRKAARANVPGPLSLRRLRRLQNWNRNAICSRRGSKKLCGCRTASCGYCGWML